MTIDLDQYEQGITVDMKSNGAMQVEKYISKQLEYLLQDQDATTEVKVASGRIDILTNDSIIEVKIAKFWKHGMGQLLAYATEHQDKALRLHLFGSIQDQDFLCAHKICKQYNIQVTHENQQYMSLLESMTIKTETGVASPKKRKREYMSCDRNIKKARHLSVTYTEGSVISIIELLSCIFLSKCKRSIYNFKSKHLKAVNSTQRLSLNNVTEIVNDIDLLPKTKSETKEYRTFLKLQYEGLKNKLSQDTCKTSIPLVKMQTKIDPNILPLTDTLATIFPSISYVTLTQRWSRIQATMKDQSIVFFVGGTRYYHKDSTTALLDAVGDYCNGRYKEQVEGYKNKQVDKITNVT